MKKFILGIIIGAIMFLPVGVMADRVIENPTANPIYDLPSSREGQVSVFDDAENKCYVVQRNYNTDEADISCVKNN